MLWNSNTLCTQQNMLHIEFIKMYFYIFFIPQRRWEETWRQQLVSKQQQQRVIVRTMGYKVTSSPLRVSNIGTLCSKISTLVWTEPVFIRSACDVSGGSRECVLWPTVSMNQLWRQQQLLKVSRLFQKLLCLCETVSFSPLKKTWRLLTPQIRHFVLET